MIHNTVEIISHTPVGKAVKLERGLFLKTLIDLLRQKGTKSLPPVVPS